MKTTTTLLIILLAVFHAAAQQAGNDSLTCDCPDCQKKAADGQSFTLPALDGLDEDHGLHEHDAEEAKPVTHDQHDPEVADDQDHDHDGHDHSVESLAEPHSGPEAAADIKVFAAEGGTISRTSVFPSEIKLNRDQTAVVSPRYASVVRQVFAEIGDQVKKDDVLASLENRETLAVYTVAAPLDGVVIAKDLSVGETVDTGKMLYEVADLSSVWADISIFPQYQHLIKKGMPVRFIAHDGHEARSTVKYISPIVSHDTRTFTARCVLKDAGDDFTPGVFVRARIITETADVRVRVERAAVQSIDGETVVFVPDDHGYEPVAVETGLSDDHFFEIRHGLEPGDPYVATGAFTLKSELLTSGMDPHAGHSH